MSEEIIIYQSQDGLVRIDVQMSGETLWLTQKQIAELFGKDVRTISEHIQNIFKEGEFDKEVVVRKSRITTQHGAIDGKTQEKEVNIYNLDAVLAVDYNAKMPETFEFFKIVQNKLHYAVSGQTASEIIFNRANANLPFMGLTVFSGNRPTKSEVSIAKNYMTEKELFALRRMVNAFFDMAELKASSQEPMYMKDWLETLDNFSRDFGVGILKGAGTISHETALDKAHDEYTIYRRQLPDEMTDVEKAYLETLKQMQKKLKDGGTNEDNSSSISIEAN